MSINKENMNSLNFPIINKKENIHKNKNKNEKPYTKNPKKAKHNSKINPINKGLNVIDQNNNFIKMSKCKNLSQENIHTNLNQNNINKPQKKIFSQETLPIEKLNKKNEQKKKKEEKKNYNLDRNNINLFVNKRESDSLLLKYGEDCYYFNKSLEKNIFKIPESLLQNHKVTSSLRTKMVDWMVEVLSFFDTMDETFFLSVNIMDIFFEKTKAIIRNEDIHLIGMASMFISCKFQEIYPLSLKNFVHKVGHDTFSQKDVKKKECEILGNIGLEILVSTSIYDFLKTYFYDFYYNNNILIKKNCDMKIYNDIKLTSKYLSKLLVHYEYFYMYENSMKAIACIMTAIKLVGFYLKEKFSQEDRNVYNQWIIFLLDQDNFDKQKIESLVNKIYLAFNHYQKSKSISKNLNRFMKLSFMYKN